MQRRQDAPARTRVGRLDSISASSLATGALLLLPGALVVYLGFNAGGFFPNTPALVTIVQCRRNDGLGEHSADGLLG
jgi:hypothetical protein